MRQQLLCLFIGLSLSGLAAAQTPVSPHKTTSATTPANTPAVDSHPAALPAGALDEETIKTRIANAGYKEVKGLEFSDDGVWETKARGGNDNWVEIKIAPVTGKVYAADAPSQLNEDEIKAKLTAAGYQNIHDVEFDDGLWRVDTDNPDGKDVELLVDPGDGSVIAEQQD